MSDTAQLQEFLARALPWPAEGEHFVNIHWTTWSEEKGRTFWSGRAVRSVKEAVNAIQWAMGLKDTRDVYICMSAQKTAQEKVSAAGNKYLLPLRSQANAHSIKSLFLDIDVKEDKGYPDIPAAVSALGSFMQATDLPRPTFIVGSGGGVHAHWVLAEAITPGEWQKLADALAEAARRHDLKCDGQCTVDSARILRPPQTRNHKTTPPRPTRLLLKPVEGEYSLERIARSLKPYEGARSHTSAKAATKEPNLVAALTPTGETVDNSELTGGIQTTGPALELDAIAAVCPFFNEAITTGGKDFAQPLWNITTLAATFTGGSRADAHRMARAHPDYEPGATEALFLRKDRERVEKGIGWPSCRAIQNAGASHCTACPHLAAGRTPFHVAIDAIKAAAPAPAAPVAAATNDLPKGYARSKDGLILTTFYGKDGVPNVVSVVNYPMTDPWLQKDPWILNFTTINHIGHTAQIALPFDKTATNDLLRKALHEHGMMVRDEQIKPLREFFMSWVEKLQKSQSSVVSSVPYGWDVQNGKLQGFVYGGRVWTKAGPGRQAANANPSVQRQFSPVGARDPWIDAAKMITDQRRPALDAILAMSFGAPLMRFTGEAGSFISAYSSESGIGKSSAVKVACAVWGHPKETCMGLKDTAASTFRRLGTVRALPMYWDELREEDDVKRFANEIVFQLTSGKEKSRAKSDMSLHDVGTWKTLLLAATNLSLIDAMSASLRSTTAGLFRIFEFHVAEGRKGQIDPTDAQRKLAKLEDNYGLIGIEYAKWLGANYEQIDNDVGGYMRDIGKRVKIRPDERYWLTAMACVFLGARYANDLGFTDIDLEELEAFLISTLTQMRTHRRDAHVDLNNATNVASILAQYLKQRAGRNTIWTDIIHNRPGRVPKGSVHLIRPAIPDLRFLDGVQVQVGLQSKSIRISSSNLQEWLQRQSVSRNAFMEALRKHFGAHAFNGRIGAGTDAAGLSEYVIEMNLVGPLLSDIVGDAVPDRAHDEAEAADATA